MGTFKQTTELSSLSESALDFLKKSRNTYYKQWVVRRAWRKNFVSVLSAFNPLFYFEY